MKTIFTMGFSTNPFSPRPSLGQETLSDKDKAALYNQLVIGIGAAGLLTLVILALK